MCEYTSSKFSELTSESCDRNARKSPFLRLPVELRERIYELVIGGHHVQIEYKPHEHRRYQKNKVKYHEHIVGGLFYFTTPNQPYLNRPFGTAYEWANFEWPARFNTGKRVTLLSGVCRRLHQKTSLLIFQSNLFSFANYWVMRKWLETLKPLQKRAMRQICLPSPDNALTKTHQNQLSGLREIFYWRGGQQTVVCEVHGSSGFEKLVTVPKPRRTWIRVENSDDDESEDDQQHQNPYQGPVNDAQVGFHNAATDEGDEDFPDLADLPPELPSPAQPNLQTTPVLPPPPAQSPPTPLLRTAPRTVSALASTIHEWQRRIRLLFKIDQHAHPTLDLFQICFDASRATSFDFRLATLVVEHMLSACSSRRERGQVEARVSDDVPGCWTEEDDRLLMKSDDPEDWAWMENKHGQEASDRRFEFLEAWERVPPAGTVI